MAQVEQMEKVFKVAEFNKFVDVYLRQVGEVAVEGEISRVDLSQNMWLFVTIKDPEATLSVFAVASQISGWRALSEGMLVRVYGKPSLHPKSGRFSLVASSIVPAGEGALRLAFEKLKAKLTAEGLFDPARKRELPMFPREIGLITAPDKEAYNDFVKVLGGRMGGLKIHFYPVAVQGRNAVGNIVRAVEYFNYKMPNLDLLVVTRGGGSLEDLQAFNDESVARAVFSSKIPVVCGVGHERDVTLCDLVCDIRASTPSNAAEIIVRERLATLGQIEQGRKYLIRQMEYLLNQEKNRVKNLALALKRATDSQLNKFRLVTLRFKNLVDRKLMEVNSVREKITGKNERLMVALEMWVRQWQKNLVNLARILASLDYKQVLARGFSLTTTPDGKIIRSIGEVKVGDPLIVQVFDGKIWSEVTKSEV